MSDRQGAQRPDLDIYMHPFRLTFLVVLVAAAALTFAAPAGAGVICAGGEQTTCEPSVDIAKYGPYAIALGQPASYDFVVNNDGAFDLHDVVVADDRCSPVSGPTVSSGDEDDVLEPGEVWLYTCSYTPAEAGAVQNQATVQADWGDEKFGDTVSDVAWHETKVLDVTIDKTVNLADADPYDVLEYTITIAFGGPDWVNVSGYLDDAGCDNLNSDGQTKGPWFWLAAGDSVTYTCEHVLDPEDPDPYVNEACGLLNVYWSEVAESTTTAQSQSEYDIRICDSASTAHAKHVASGVVFEDMNADGSRQEGDPGMPGVVVYADLNGNGARDEGEPHTTTDANGHYSVSVPLGTTTIRQETPAGATCSFPVTCSHTVDLPKNDPPAPPPVDARATDPTGLDFGNWHPASVTGVLRNDVDGDGVADVGDGAIPGGFVFADLNGNGTLDIGEPSASTAADGSYALTGLKPGGYVVRHVVPGGRSCTAPANCNHNLTLVSGASSANRDFMTHAPAQVVAGERIVAGLVRFRSATGCVRDNGFYAGVRGRSINRVMFFLDGRYQRAILRPNNGRTYRFRVDVRKLKLGRHTVMVKVTFTSASRTKSRTLRLTFQRCARRVVAPRFTG
jgi:hypothetical protein